MRILPLFRLIVLLLCGAGGAVAGAEGAWWSLAPLVAPSVPEVTGVVHPVDRFLQARLAEKGLTPSPRADARTLLRRVMLDVTGLPPSPEEVAAFQKECVADPSDAPWRRLVDRLLASPRYGERWARHWLDTIHFADTHGFEHDVHRPHAWRFRDYVIQAFNADTPWPRFIREQLAADVLYPDEPRLTAALGFLGAGPFDASAEGTAQAAFEYVDRDDLVTQTMGAFVSTTASCARCHAHKFDPISQEDYFSLQAVFAGVGKGNVSYDEDAAVAAKRKHWTAILHAADGTGPLQPEVLLTAENAALVAEWEAASGRQEMWQVLPPDTFTSAIGAVLTRLADGSVLSSGPRPDTETFTLSLTSPLRRITGLKLELLPDDSLPLKGPGRTDNGNVHVTEVELHVFRAGGSSAERVAFASASADFDQASYAAPGLIDGDAKTSWAIHPRVGETHHAILRAAQPVELGEADRLSIVLKQFQPGHVLGRFRLSASSAPAETLIALSAAGQAALAVPRDQRSAEQQLALAAAVLHPRAMAELAALPAQAMVYAASAENQAARGAILKARQPRVIRVLARGDLNKPGAEAGPGALSAIAALPGRFSLADPQNEGLRRAALAEWIAAPQNPLTWRSVVNRVWHYHFGRGLCDTPSDFGRMGGVPSHPELLDWLAVWFRDEAHGSLKALHRLILTSAAWQQSSALRADAAAQDPDNRLLWRMSPQRMDADTCRDSIMAMSGRLDLTMGGPGVPHFNASPGPQATPVLDYAGYDWDTPGATRRSIYRVVYRGIADPFMEALDFPDMGMLSPVRGFSASPLQSLALFNNPFVLNQSGHLAARLAVESPEPSEQVRLLFARVLLREPSADEMADFTALAGQDGIASAARTLFNTSEFLFID